MVEGDVAPVVGNEMERKMKTNFNLALHMASIKGLCNVGT